MCIIITKEKNANPINKEVFENCWDNNPDGAGILFHDGKTSTLIKGIMNKKEFLEKVELANKKENSFIIHTRIATHGSVKPENTHPFVSDTLGFAHNGTMPIEPLKDRTDSESFFLWTIADKDFEWCKENKFLLDLATHGSRCVIFDMRTGEMIHLCEDDWKKDEKYVGYSFSNTSYSYKKWTQSTGYKYGKYDNYGCYGSYDSETNRYYGSSYYDNDDLLDFGEEAFIKNKEKIKKEKEFINAVNADALRRNKKGMLTCVHDWITMYLDTYAEKGGNDKYLLKEKIKEMDEYVSELQSLDGKFSLEANALNVMRQFFDTAYCQGYLDVFSIKVAFKEYVNSIFPENQETQLFVNELHRVMEDYK